ncbi:MAG: hypothetical protein PHI49_12060 [Halothiobacillaceae bacterium]|nr:hypothetical protein [Halothiobacillaceae bacterium]
MSTHTRVVVVLGLWLAGGMTGLIFGWIPPSGAVAWVLAYTPALILMVGSGFLLVVAVVSLFLGLMSSPPRR